MRKDPRRTFDLFLTLGCVVALGTTTIAQTTNQKGQSRARRSLQAPLPTTSAEMAVRMTPVVRAVRQAAPSVISVYVRNANRPRGFTDSNWGFSPDGQGSGVIIDEIGLALTNWHVVAMAISGEGVQRSDRRVEARLRTGQVVEARVLSSSPEKDLALLRIEVPKGIKLQALELGNSDNLMMAETVIAIGNPLGQADTVSVGVLSARNRNIGVRTPDGRVRRYKGLLQTDAAINPGNSGGALIDLNGKLVGINNAKANGGIGIGFSIPVNTVRQVFKEELLSVDRLRSAYLGIKVRQRDAGRGVLISSVTKQSPAATAGARVGDRIVALAGQSVATAVDFARARLVLQANKTVPLVVDRNGDRRRLSIRPLPYLAWNVVQQTGLWLEPVSESDNRGLLRQASRIVGNELRVPRVRLRALLRVKNVTRDSPAAKLGIRDGDAVLGLEVPRFNIFGEVVRTTFAPFQTFDEANYYLSTLSRMQPSRYELWVLRDGRLLTGPLELRRRRR